VGAIAHGGHCVARHEGRVIFVRHALPGERVLVRLTDTSHERFWRADAVDILTLSADRVPVRCPVAGPGLCGGCDFQHVDLTAQRRLKASVVAEQLQRLAGLAWSGEVEEVPGAVGGLGWRRRMRYQVDQEGRPGLRAHRSHAVVALPGRHCPIASPGAQPPLGAWPSGTAITVVEAATGTSVLVGDELVQGTPLVTEHAADRNWSVPADGFWQVHPGAADTLVAAVLQGLNPRAGERAFDLYCGVGLFAGALVDAGCRVWGVESYRPAVDLARQNLADAGRRAHFVSGRVDRALGRLPERCDLVVLDPPRAGAGMDVVRSILSRRPRGIAYVACDPAAMARDLATAAATGYRLASLRAFDLFPMTHHVECVAILEPVAQPD
jgi:tRNA/tmRNA/rRNA uracil-C5-methylase (TrmA/RlmC/RlmD family)